MNTKPILIIICLSIISLIVGLIGTHFEIERLVILADGGLSIFILSSTYLLMKNGEFIKSKEFKFFRLAISLIIVGVMFKIMHWPMSAQILALGILSMIILYLIYIIKKDNKNWTNWLKAAFLLFFLSSRYATLVHWPFKDELTIISMIILGVVLVNFFVSNGMLINNKME